MDDCSCIAYLVRPSNPFILGGNVLQLKRLAALLRHQVQRAAHRGQPPSGRPKATFAMHEMLFVPVGLRQRDLELGRRNGGAAALMAQFNAKASDRQLPSSC
ncbi:hypothetical protein [Cupriavidus consociatus]|uniref:hypothetical protein n=1 Tax=Cupriavidus consociatus TaxID=2821357 RepID=UPI001AE7D385|nr:MULTISPECIES: hypothetical protein [unclassified Cupriavidus]MBP0624135.1 hypothetical protein [Cupriavidus sp. LEh25]MDK2660848.1 hypothetical protein [Cupriavidus sp. LEh21]